VSYILKEILKPPKKKLTWLPKLADGELVDVFLHEYHNLIIKEKLEDDDEFEDFVNPKIHDVTDAKGDPSLRMLKKGDRLQLERTGYFIVDKAYSQDDHSPVHLILIPDGKTTSVYKRG